MRTMVGVLVVLMFGAAGMANAGGGDGAAAQGNFSASLWGAYSKLAMAGANSALDYAKDSALTSGAQITQYTQLGPAWEAGLDLGYTVLPGLSLGPRIEWIRPKMGKSTRRREACQWTSATPHA